MHVPHALVVDDDAVSRLVLAHMLRRAGWQVTEADDIAPARDLVASNEFTAVFSDFSMPGGTGLDLLDGLGPPGQRPLFVLITGIVEYASAAAGPEHKVDAHLTKPISTRELANCLAEILPGARGR